MTRAQLRAAVLALIDRLADGSRDDIARDHLLRQLLRLQRDTVAPYGRMVTQLANAEPDPLRWPALPTDVFRFARVAAHEPAHDVRVFRTSGTSSGTRGSHALRDLGLYDRAAEAAARHALFPDVARMQLVILASPAAELPDSSLSYMLEKFIPWFGDARSLHAVRNGQLAMSQLEATLARAQAEQRPVALLGTSFAFVHADDAFGARRFVLPVGSRIMQTGGFKGRSREVDPTEMLQLLAQRYGIPEPFIVQEYGMTELSSQLYETTLRDVALGREPGPRRLWVPGWVRVSAVDPNTLGPVSEHEEGLLRIDDPCNLDSVCAIQSSDRTVIREDGVLVLGRAPGATARGCSIAADSALGGLPEGP